MEPAKFKTPQQFARILRVPVGRVVSWIRTGRLPHVKLGRTVLIPDDALTRLLASKDPVSETMP